MASYRQYRSVSNYNRNQRSKYGSSGLHYDDPYVRYNMKDIPGIGDVLRASDWNKYWNDYFANTGLSWKDVKYPALMSGSSWIGGTLGAITSGTSLVISRNLLRMYR